jgi:hypothetical protein
VDLQGGFSKTLCSTRIPTVMPLVDEFGNEVLSKIMSLSSILFKHIQQPLINLHFLNQFCDGCRSMYLGSSLIFL